MTFIYPDERPEIKIDAKKDLRCPMCRWWFPWKGNVPSYNRVKCPRCETMYPYPLREIHHHVGWGENDDHIQRVEYIKEEPL